MVVIAKMKFNAIKTSMYGEKKIATLEFSVVGGTEAENKKFFEWTPTGAMTLGTVNQAVIESMDLGKDYYVIITQEKPQGL